MVVFKSAKQVWQLVENITGDNVCSIITKERLKAFLPNVRYKTLIAFLPFRSNVILILIYIGKPQQ